VSATIHVIGAGLAGLSAATRLAERGSRLVVYEAARMAGGRCRSYFDQQLGLTIDNGNHLLLSCNHAAMDYLARIGAKNPLEGPAECAFDFYDLKDDARWRLRPNDGRLPWWIFSTQRRVPGTGVVDYLRGASLLTAPRTATVAQALRPSGALWDKMWTPVLVSALNTKLNEASAHLAAAIVKESLAQGGANARPRVPASGLGPAFIDPARAFLQARGAEIRFGARLRAIEFDGARATTLRFGDGDVAIGAGDKLIFAAPAWTALELLPGIRAPNEHRAIFNAHYALAPKAGTPLLTGVVGGYSEWLFAFHDRLSVTISAADDLIETAPDDIAERIWREICAIARLGDTPMPANRLVREKRATFAATPAQDALRPQTQTGWSNLYLAGDWTQTGLPATIEGAIRSGVTAAAAVERAL
jgi:squalene-associated FAD-dependent desaturase